MHDDWLPAGWLQPGRMVVEEQLDDSRAVQVRLDCGVIGLPQIRDDVGNWAELQASPDR